MGTSQELVVAFTGHRPDKLDKYDREWIAGALINVLRDLKPVGAISGMAVGLDQMAAQCCNHLQIPWTAAIPFVGQELVWPKSAQREYHKLLLTARGKVVVCQPVLEAWRMMQLRNEWMVDNCDVVIAVWDGSKGGTANCVKFAELMGKKIVYIDPKKMIIRYSWA